MRRPFLALVAFAAACPIVLHAGNKSLTCALTAATSCGDSLISVLSLPLPTSVIQLNPSSLAFGDQTVGVESAAKLITVTNTSASTISVSSVAVTGANTVSFTQTNNCPSNLAVSATCTINVTFQPTGASAKSASVTVVNGAGTQSATLTGTGVTPAISVSPANIAYGSETVGLKSTKAVTVSNGGTSAISFMSIAITPTGTVSYTQTNNCGTSLAAGANCTINVAFDPASAGAKTASVTLIDSDGTQTVALTGTGLASPIALSSTSIAFGSEPVAVKTVKPVTVKNNGTSAVAITKIAITPTGTVSFTQTNDCGASVAAGGNCTVNVTFDPASVGAKTASVTLTDTDGTQAIALTGTGIAPPISLSPLTIAFGSEPLGEAYSTPVTMTNNTSGAIPISSIAITPAGTKSYTQTNDCPLSIAAGASCTINVTFLPQSPGIKNDFVTVVDGVGTQTVALTGVVPPIPHGLTFASPVSMNAGGQEPIQLAVADFNRDGKLDFAVANQQSNSISVFLNNGDGTFSAPIVTTVQVAGGNLSGLAVGDFNEDHKADLIVATNYGFEANYVLLGNGDGTFKQLPQMAGDGGFVFSTVADVNGDGHLDLVVAGDGEAAVYLGKGDGTFNADVSTPSVGYDPAYGLTVGDFNGDNKPDIALAMLASSGHATLGVFLGNGDGTFQPGKSESLAATIVSRLASADFNGDGKIDLIVGYQNLDTFAAGAGDGTFDVSLSLATVVYGTDSTDPTDGMILRVADFDGDGKPDVVAADYALGSIGIILDRGFGASPTQQAAQIAIDLAPVVNDIQVGDFNGDGIPDIVACNKSTNQVTVILSKKQ